MKSILVAAFAAAMFSPVWAQPQKAPYAKIKVVEGIVSVSGDQQMRTAVVDLAMDKGWEVVTSSNGKTTITFSNGCEVKLDPNVKYKVDAEECAALLAKAPPLPPLAIAAGALGWVVLYDMTGSRRLISGK